MPNFKQNIAILKVKHHLFSIRNFPHFYIKIRIYLSMRIVF